MVMKTSNNKWSFPKINSYRDKKNIQKLEDDESSFSLF